MMSIPFHPIANVFPLLEGPAFDDLVADIAEHGIREPIWLYDGAILDGRNRYRAAQQLGIECPCRTYEGADPVGFVISMNLRRRHLTESQRAMIAARLATMRVGRPEKAPIDTFSQADAGKQLKVSERSVERATRIRKRGAPELTRAVEAGELAVSAALPLTDLPTDQQAEAYAEAKAEAGNGKVTVRHTKAVVSRKQRLQNSDETPPAGMSARETVSHTPDTQNIPHPTSGQATALTQGTEQDGRSVATEGTLQTGRSHKKERTHSAFLQRVFPMFNALAHLTSLQDIPALIAEIPEYAAYRIDQDVDAAVANLHTCADAWRRRAHEASKRFDGRA
jgi:hypothetical protein